MPPAVTLDGELFGALDDAPAGRWLAEMLAAVDRSRLTTLELPGYLRACSRMQAWAGAQLAAVVAELASRPDAFGPDKVIAETIRRAPHLVRPTAIGNLIPLDRTWHSGKTRGELTATVDNSGPVCLTTASGQSRIVTPYDYRMTQPPSGDTTERDQYPALPVNRETTATSNDASVRPRMPMCGRPTRIGSSRLRADPA